LFFPLIVPVEDVMRLQPVEVPRWSPSRELSSRRSHDAARLAVVAVLALAWLCVAQKPAKAQTADGSLYVTNGPVSAEALSGNTLYIAGIFDQVGPATGGGVPLDASSGAPVSGFPKVNGIVLAAVADGHGGQYIGGFFTTVGGAAHHGIAHIFADNSVAPWDAGVDGQVAAIAIDGNTLYVGGGFAQIGGQPRSNIAALDATTGTVTAWDPHAAGQPLGLAVTGLAVSGSTVYAVGEFRVMGHVGRHNIAAIDAVTGSPTGWNPDADFNVVAVAVIGGSVYACGQFNHIGGQPRAGLAALDGTTGLATAWDPNANNSLNFTSCSDLAVSGTLIYAQGDFTHIGGQDRNYLAALDATTGLATPWDPSPDSPAGGALAVNGTTVYVGGGFSHIGGQARSRLAALDATTGLATAWNPSANNAPVALVVNGNTVYAGGYFTSVGGQARNGFAAIDVTTGRVTAWDPNAQLSNGFGRFALAVSGRTVYAAGPFVTVGGQSRNYFAALDSQTGVATAWDPNADEPQFNEIYSLAVSGNRVFAAGDFTHIGGQPRLGLAALDGSTGLADDWDPAATVDGGTPEILTLAASGSVLYSGGSFTSIGGQARNGLAALDAATGLATPWNPDPDANVTALAMHGRTVYVGGRFTHISGQDRDNLAALDATTGMATAWSANVSGPVFDNGVIQAFALNGATIYVGGDFTTIGGQPRNGLAALDATTGAVLVWDSGLSTLFGSPSVSALAVRGGRLFVGGAFLSMNDLPQSYLAEVATANRQAQGNRAPAIPAPSLIRIPGLASSAFQATSTHR
jgi:hypothetical protein